MSIVIVTAQNKGRRRGGKEDRKKKKSQVPPSLLFEYKPALTAKVKKPAYSICTKGSCFDLPPVSAIIFGAQVRVCSRW